MRSVYPRVCGGAYFACPRVTSLSGLSPRVRGSLGAWRRGVRDCRSIPACAGEPPLASALAGPKEVYPRVCGGAWCRERSCLIPYGLSPRVRGSPRAEGELVPRPGSIPACAGEPRCRSRANGCRAVYPRVCGGAVRISTNLSELSGLSPRVRGSPPLANAIAYSLRSIPACAGEPTLWTG